MFMYILTISHLYCITRKDHLYIYTLNTCITQSCYLASTLTHLEEKRFRSSVLGEFSIRQRRAKPQNA
jgi:hypothetical protein